MPRILFFLSILTSLVYGETINFAAISENANHFYSSFNEFVKILRWILALIPMVLFIWGVTNTAKHYMNYSEGGGEGNSFHANTMLNDITASLFSMAFALTAVFLIYGVFGSVYANPEGNMSYTGIWNKIVVSFYKEILTFNK